MLKGACVNTVLGFGVVLRYWALGAAVGTVCDVTPNRLYLLYLVCQVTTAFGHQLGLSPHSPPPHPCGMKTLLCWLKLNSMFTVTVFLFPQLC